MGKKFKNTAEGSADRKFVLFKKGTENLVGPENCHMAHMFDPDQDTKSKHYHYVAHLIVCIRRTFDGEVLGQYFWEA